MIATLKTIPATLLMSQVRRRAPRLCLLLALVIVSGMDVCNVALL